MTSISTNARGFSLVELMVCVSIIGILTALGTPTFQGMINKSRVSRARAEMVGIRSAIMGLRASEDKLLLQITGTMSTAAYLQGRQVGVKPVCTIPDGAPDTWKMLGYDKVPRDPWGNCFLIDENEEEFGPTDCRFDVVISGGEDMIWQGSGDGDDVFGDDLITRAPFQKPKPTCRGGIDGQYGGS